NKLYVLYTPPNVHVQLGSQNSQTDFPGYHLFFAMNGTVVHYAVITHPTGNLQVTSNSFDQLTLDSSHELVEAVTDPEGSAWYDETVPPGEIADFAVGAGANYRYDGYLVTPISAPNDANHPFIFGNDHILSAGDKVTATGPDTHFTPPLVEVFDE